MTLFELVNVLHDGHVYEKIAFNTNAIDSIQDAHPNGTYIKLNGDSNMYYTHEPYAVVIGKILEAEDKWYFDNYVIKRYKICKHHDYSKEKLS